MLYLWKAREVHVTRYVCLVTRQLPVDIYTVVKRFSNVVRIRSWQAISERSSVRSIGKGANGCVNILHIQFRTRGNPLEELGMYSSSQSPIGIRLLGSSF